MARQQYKNQRSARSRRRIMRSLMFTWGMKHKHGSYASAGTPSFMRIVK